MKNNNFLKALVLTSALLCNSASFAIEKNKSSDKDIHQAVGAVQQMNSSMQKINVIFSQCHMDHNCILKALSILAHKEKDPLAQSMLDDFERHEILDSNVFSQCFELQKREVDKALLMCLSQSRNPPFLDDKTQCYENALIKQVEDGNAVAQQVLFTLYQMQSDIKKLEQFQENLNKNGEALHRKGNERCLKMLKKKT